MSSFAGVARWRVAVVALLASLLLGGVVTLALPGVAPLVDAVLAGGRTDPTYDALLVALASTALLVAAPWCWVLVALVCVDALRGSERRRRGCPAALRRGVLLALGATTAVALAQPASAQPAAGPAGEPSTTGDTTVGAVTAAGAVAGGRGASPTADLLDGLPLPDRPGGTIPDPGPAAAAGAAADQPDQPSQPDQPDQPSRPSRPSHVVVAGDDLWSIAAAHLPAAADDAAVLEATLALHRANAAVIGPDPDLILPGQRLDLGALSRPSE
ncbi:hypothetical protein [Nocardioides zeae]|uniref:LysM domain-containing protein n=1 Tax=Nocardioides zeae TaxID=1457234 RepID=A0A6P0HF42_9ACTN|nr:hypothetical protein [Nocardioides zeae]NEN76964.1 hypothetical protein [Nocardioides zeae]